MRKIIIAALLSVSATPASTAPDNPKLDPLNPAFKQTLAEDRAHPLAVEKIDTMLLRHLGLALHDVCPLGSEEWKKWAADVGLTEDEKDVMGQLCLAYMEGQLDGPSR